MPSDLQPIAVANGLLSQLFGVKLIKAADNRYVKYDYAPHVRSRQKQGRSAERLRALIQKRDASYAAILRQFATFHKHLVKIPSATSNPRWPSWVNGFIPALDNISIYCLLAMNNPSVYFEVGSGNSTKFARRAIDDHKLRTRIVSIDPYPRAEIDAICDEIVRVPCEDLARSAFEDLPSSSVVFVDNSHRAFQNSDVTVFFTEILPGLKAGVIYGVQDIFLPDDYPPEWEQKHYNEQYLLETYLYGGAGGGQILLPGKYVSNVPELHRLLGAIWDHPNLKGAEKDGGGFWLTKA